MDYKASMDNTAKLITAICFLLFAFIIYRGYLSVVAGHYSHSLYYFGAVTAILLCTFLGSLLTSTWRYRVTETSLVIVTPIYNKVINKADIESVSMTADLGFVIRTFGNGGLFGYYGWYRSPVEGSIFYYATQQKNRILIKLKNGEKYLITPDDSALLDALK